MFLQQALQSGVKTGVSARLGTEAEILSPLPSAAMVVSRGSPSVHHHRPLPRLHSRFPRRRERRAKGGTPRTPLWWGPG